MLSECQVCAGSTHLPSYFWLLAPNRSVSLSFIQTDWRWHQTRTFCQQSPPIYQSDTRACQSSQIVGVCPSQPYKFIVQQWQKEGDVRCSEDLPPLKKAGRRWIWKEEMRWGGSGWHLQQNSTLSVGSGIWCKQRGKETNSNPRDNLVDVFSKEAQWSNISREHRLYTVSPSG